MNAGHYTEDELAGFARSSAPNGDKHLSACRMCRSRYEFFVDFYRVREEQTKQPMSQELQRFVALRTVPNVIELKPYHAQADMQSLGVGEHTLVLAAQDTPSTTSSVHATMTFANMEQAVLMRAVRDELHKRYSLHLLAPIPELVDRVLVVLKELDQNVIACATTNKGHAALDRSDPIDWKSCGVTVLRPLAVFSIEGSVISEGLLSSNGFTLEVMTDGNQWTFTLAEGSPEEPTRVLILKSDGQSSLRDIVARQFTLLGEDANHVVELRLFT